ncbi:MAG TPA: hypothetical protein VJ206_04320 [bacterium]|nr:hypothetical protein [bacterium]
MRRVVDLIQETTRLPVEILVSVVEDDRMSQEAIRGMPMLRHIRTVDEYELGAVYAWNKLATLAMGDVLALWADDLLPCSGWAEAALGALDEMGGHGVVGFNDLASDGEEYAAHWLADRAFINEHLGGAMYPPVYKSWWADREVTDVAKSLGCYRWCRQAVVEHLNYTFGKSPEDRTYREAARNYEADRVVYESRRRQAERASARLAPT